EPSGEAPQASTDTETGKSDGHPLAQHESPEEGTLDRSEVASQLDKQFKRRASLDVLKDHGIYLGQVLHDAEGKPYAGGASALQSVTLQIEKDKNRSQLEYLLETRPGRDMIFEHHGVASAQIAPSIQPNRRALDMALRRKSLKYNLAHRPKPET